MPEFIVIKTLVHAVWLGVAATALLDLWLLLLKRLGVPTGSFALIGRWVGHMRRGRFSHPAIAAAAPLRHELALGWAVHYAVGIAFAAALLALQGPAWLAAPQPLPALLFGLATVALPMLVMQPAMGLGVAASKTPTPLRNSLRSLANHLIFGLGLYLTALAARLLA
ncbi:DUF2938 family protein [Paucibacter sp. APW11]|uniref:DUF2938 family protein n=1 Tax=Roseateles aquae TaxID=3077235 RepID=A0ABU3PGI2_9BURK|nr:DUF2938 family protein [Paucibacter sp. APW11]MDT9001081.1 DUF2938 family protein [Paucibacter sp. APW11]